MKCTFCKEETDRRRRDTETGEKLKEYVLVLQAIPKDKIKTSKLEFKDFITLSGLNLWICENCGIVQKNLEEEVCLCVEMNKE